jgi:hypothetical protein
MMGDNIYRSAQKVYAWLGIADADTDYALQHTIPSTAENKISTSNKVPFPHRGNSFSAHT